MSPMAHRRLSGSVAADGGVFGGEGVLAKSAAAVSAAARRGSMTGGWI